MKKALSRLPLPGRKQTASQRLQANNTWQHEPDFTTTLSDSEDEDGQGNAAALTSANLRAHKGRPVTNEGQRKERAHQNAMEWVHSSPAPAGGAGRAMSDDSSADESRPNAESSRLDPGSSRRAIHAEEEPVGFGAIQPFSAKRGANHEDQSGSDDTPLGQTMFDELTRQRSNAVQSAEGKKKTRAHKRVSSARKVTYQLTDDSESMDDSELPPRRSGLMYGIHQGPSYHDPLEREISQTLDVYASRNKVSRSSSRGGQGFGGLNSERSMLSTMNSPQARARAMAEADDLLDMYAQPRGAIAPESPDLQSNVTSGRQLQSAGKSGVRLKSALRVPSNESAANPGVRGAGPPKLQYANGLGSTQTYNISDSSESEGENASASDRRSIPRRNIPGESDSLRMANARMQPQNAPPATASSFASSDAGRNPQVPRANPGLGATDTLARSLHVISKVPARNPEYLPDLDDSDSDVLRQSTDSEVEGSEAQDTLRRLEVAHAKTAPFKLDAMDDFDNFMKSVDKSVHKAVKVEKRALSRAGSRPGSRAVSRQSGRERLSSRGGSRVEMRRQHEAGSVIVSTSTSNVQLQKREDKPRTAGGQGNLNAPQRPYSKQEPREAVAKELAASVGLRRQHLAQIENGRVVPHAHQQAVRGTTATMPGPTINPVNAMSPESPIRRPMTTHHDIVLAEQQEEMEMLMEQQKQAMQKEREQQEILKRLKRDQTRKATKHKDTQQQLEQLWEQQIAKDDLQYQQQKEIERLRHALAMREQLERQQAEELENLRRDVADRARADVEGAAAFDRLLQEKHKSLLYTPDEIRKQVDEQMQRNQLQREQEAELRKIEAEKEEEARQALMEAQFQSKREQIERDGSKYGTSGMSNAHALRHQGPTYDEDGNYKPSNRGQVRNLGSPSQLSRPATQLSTRKDGSRPGTSASTFSVESTSTDIREVKEASQSAMQIKNRIKQQAATFKAQNIPGYVGGVGRTRQSEEGAEGAESLPAHKVKASACKETPDIMKERHQAVKKLNLDAIKSKHEKAPALKKFELDQQVRDHATELQRASDDARHRSELAEAKRVLDGPKSRASQRATSAPKAAQGSADPTLQEELQRLEEEKAEFERREMLHEEYIQQLRFEQEEKLEREAAKRKALQDLRGENSIIDRMLRETDKMEGDIIKEVGTLEALKEQYRRKQKLAEQLKQQQEELAAKQKEREEHLKSLKSEVGKASDAAGIQLMQMNRLKAIQEEAMRMQEQQHQELEFLKSELQRKADLTGEQEEINRLRAEMEARQAEQAEARAKLKKEKDAVEQAMRQNEETEREMQRLQREKEKREEAERNLRQMLAMESREMERLQEEANKRKSEIEALKKEREATLKEVQGTEKEKLQQELEELRKRREQLAENESAIEREKRELEELNERREQELQELEALRKQSEKIERQQAKAKAEEEAKLRAKEKQEQARLRAEEDRVRAALEYEAQKAQREMEKERKKRQNEIDRLKKEIQNKKISENAPIEEEEEDEEEQSSAQKVSDWLQSNDPEDMEEDKRRAKKEKKKKQKSAAGNITARSMNDEDDDGGGNDGNFTDRSDGSGKGPPTQWRLARHGKIKDLEAILTTDNVDDRDGKGNTCLHHACMQGKKRVAKMLLRLGADINAQNRRGHTCLHYCFAYSYDELGEYLISKGADETILNEMGATCREVESGSVTSRAGTATGH